MRQITNLILILSAVIMPLSACTRPTVAMDAAPTAAGPGGGPALEEDYKLGVGDKLRMIVYNEETLSGEFQVNASGNLALPLVGEIPAINRTTKQIAETVRSQLADGYLRDPRVSVEVLTYRPYYILGEVKTPGQYPYVNGLTVMNAIASAAGYTPRADRKIVLIRHSGEDRERAYKLTPDLKVLPGDTLRLDERLF